jgi:hypothetical protein
VECHQLFAFFLLLQASHPYEDVLESMEHDQDRSLNISLHDDLLSNFQLYHLLNAKDVDVPFDSHIAADDDSFLLFSPMIL